MLVLAYDTSTPISSVGWVEADAGGPRPVAGRFASFVAPAVPGHAETLLDRIGAALATGGHALADVGLIVYGRGPGTFTGLRIGLATAKGLALASGVPILGVSSLESLALSCDGEGLALPLIDARRGELYAALYETRRDDGWPSARLVAAEQVVRPDGVARLIGDGAGAGPVRLLGNGALRYSGALAGLGPVLPPSAAAPDPFWTALVGLERYLARGADDPETAEPSYLREPDAKLPAGPI